MNTCKHCKFWVLDKDACGTEQMMCTPTDPDTCKPMVFDFEVRVCTHPSQTFCERPIERNGFGLADGSTYTAMLTTAEEFGCVRFELKQ